MSNGGVALGLLVLAVILSRSSNARAESDAGADAEGASSPTPSSPTPSSPTPSSPTPSSPTPSSPTPSSLEPSRVPGGVRVPLEPDPVPPRGAYELPPVDPTDPHARWQPSPAARAAGDAIQQGRQVPNVQGSPLSSDDPREAQLPVQPGVRALARWIRQQTGVRSGTARGPSVQAPTRRPDGSLRNRDVHEEGRALDVMTSNVALGSRIADFLVEHARELGVQLVIWRSLAWSSDPHGRAFTAYRGRSRHEDHVHVELTPATAVDGEHITRTLEGLRWAP